MSGFSVDFVSPAKFNSLAAEVSFESQILCRIDKERADGALEIEFFHETRLLGVDPKMKFPIKDFLEVVEQACTELRNIPE
jgi:hypothetical protein